MGRKILCLTLMIVAVSLIMENVFASRQFDDSLGDEAVKVMWNDKKSTTKKQYKNNPKYSTTSKVQNYRIENRFPPQNSRQDESVISKYDKLTDSANGIKRYDNYQASGHVNADNKRCKNSKGCNNGDDYNDEYNHGYHHSHGYHRRHHHHKEIGNNGGDGDYHRHQNVRLQHDHDYEDHEGRENDKDECDYDGCERSDYRYNKGFGFYYENNGNDLGDKNNYDGDGYDEYTYHYNSNNEHYPGNNYNEDADDHGYDYHRDYTGSVGSHGYGNYGKGYSG